MHVAWPWNGGQVYKVRTMSMNLIRFIKNNQRRALRSHVEVLRYRGVAYRNPHYAQ